MLLRQKVEDLEGKLATYVSRKLSARAQINQSKTKIAESRDTLGRTEVRLPFDARIGTVSVEKGGFTMVGSLLFKAFGTDQVEINAQLSTRQFQPLISGLSGRFNLQKPKGLHAAIKSMKLDVKIRLAASDGGDTEWQGKLVRISERVDPTRDTAGLIVAINDPYKGVIPGKRPPLLKGMYMEVEFIAPPKNRLVIPRKALHQGRVYIANKQKQLEIRKVNIIFQQGQLIVIDNSVKANEQVIISDVIPVINGLPLITIRSKKIEKQLRQDAIGIEEQKTKEVIK